MYSAKIIGLGKYLPKDKLTNSDLEKMVDTSDEWITTRTGIKERRILKEKKGASFLAYEASLSALKMAGLNPKDIELIIVATITPDMPFPSTGCFLQKHLSAKNAAAFDISAACSGFIYALITAYQFISTGLYKNALVVGSEVLSTVVDWKDRSTCVLFGDGAGAVVLTRSKEKTLLGSYMASDGSFAHLLMIPAGGSVNPASTHTVNNKLHYIKMCGNELFKIAVRMMVKAAQESIKSANISVKDISLFIPHQANERIINAVLERLSLPKEKAYINIHRYGNMSSASVVIALVEAYEENRIKKNDILLLDTFGAGLVCGSCVLKWV